MAQKKVQKVAIIGSGLAGLCSAHLLSEIPKNSLLDNEKYPLEFEVHVFEKNTEWGLDQASLTITRNNGTQKLTVDTPMRSLQTNYYRQTINMCQYLGLDLIEKNYNYSFSRNSKDSLSKDGSNNIAGGGGGSGSSSSDGQSYDCYFIFSGSNGLTFPPVRIPSTYNTPIKTLGYFFYVCLITISYFQLLFCAIISLYILPSSWSYDLDFGSWCQLVCLSNTFVQDILLPLFACVCTCSLDEVCAYPAASILLYVVQTFAQNHVTVKGGVSNLVNKLLQNIPKSQQHVNTPIVSISKCPPTPSLDSTRSNRSVRIHSQSGQYWDFDHVILATPSLQAAQLLETYDNENDERCSLTYSLPSTASLVVNHVDPKIAPPQSNVDRRDLNLVVPHTGNNNNNSSNDDVSSSSSQKQLISPIPNDSKSCGNGKVKDKKPCPSGYVMATHCIGDDFYQTTNATAQINNDKAISTTWFSRARVTVNSHSSIQRLQNLQGKDGIWLAGAWSVPGIPLLESCVRSAEKVVCDGIAKQYHGEFNVPW